MSKTFKGFTIELYGKEHALILNHYNEMHFVVSRDLIDTGTYEHCDNLILEYVTNFHPMTPKRSLPVLINWPYEDRLLTLDRLKERVKNNESFEYIFFYGHTPSKDGSVNKSCFSQWFKATFSIDGVTFPTAEHWMMYSKAKLFKDQESMKRILETDDPHTAKSIGRKVKNYDEYIWNLRRRMIVTKGNLAKFEQNLTLKQYLLSTEKKVLVESSPFDIIWGIGLSIEDSKNSHPDNWRGQNLLGFSLMDVREQLYLQEIESNKT